MSTFEAGQIVTVFRSRLREENLAAYAEDAPRIYELATTMPGFVDAKGFVSEDGEHVTIVTFSDIESQMAWKQQVDHVAAQERGRYDYYAEFSTQVCQTLRVNTFS